MDKPWGDYAKWNKPIIQRQIPYDSTYKRYLKCQIHRNKEWNGGCQALGEGAKGSY